ncbi:MAG: STAS/SEC14 domain-containing protein [Acidimicrobiia bacterium]
MDSFKVTDEGGGIIRVDAESRLVRKALAEEMCAAVDEVATRYDGRFKILMNMGAMSKGTPGAGFYTLRRMKEYDMTALALFRANTFMRRMAQVVLGLNGFSNFALFDDEVEARAWLERADDPVLHADRTGPAEPGNPEARSRRAPLVAAATAAGLALVVAARRRRRAA